MPITPQVSGQAVAETPNVPHSVPETSQDRKELSECGKDFPKPTTEDARSENAVRKCQKCGSPTRGEEAWVDGQIWCHPCADSPEHFPQVSGADQ